MEKNELIITTAKDIFLRIFDFKDPAAVLGVSREGKMEKPVNFISTAGDQFKILVQKVAEAFNELK